VLSAEALCCHARRLLTLCRHVRHSTARYGMPPMRDIFRRVFDTVATLTLRRAMLLTPLLF